MHPRIKSGLPLIPLSATEIQIGTEPGLHLRLDCQSSALLDFIKLLDGHHSLDDAQMQSGLPLKRVARVVDQLTQSGLLELPGSSSAAIEGMTHQERSRLAQDALAWSVSSSPPSRQRLTRRRQAWIDIHSSGRMSFSLAQLLASAGIGRITINDGSTVQEMDCGPFGASRSDIGKRASQTIYRKLRHYFPSTIRVSHPSAKPDVTILAPNQSSIASQKQSELMRGDQAHIPVIPRAGGFLVGPFVIPGSTACIACDELVLAQTSAEHSWIATALGTQPSTTIQPNDMVLSLMVASLVALQALMWVDADQAPTLVNQIATVSLPAGSIQFRATTQHPSCGCGWSHHQV